MLMTNPSGSKVSIISLQLRVNYSIVHNQRVPYLNLHQFTDTEWDILPHFILTVDDYLNPPYLIIPMMTVSDTTPNVNSESMECLFDELSSIINSQYLPVGATQQYTNFRATVLHITYGTRLWDIPSYSGFDSYWECEVHIFMLLSVCSHYCEHHRHYKSPFHSLNVYWRNESTATDMVYSDTPALDNLSTSSQIFVGTVSLVTDVFSRKLKKMVNFPQRIL